jgi:peptide deformylase
MSQMITIDTGLGIRKHEIYKLVSENDPALWQPTEDFDFANPPIDPVYLAGSLFGTMFANRGIGLSANQVGLPYRVFVVGLENENKQVFFNPKIVAISDEIVTYDEGCLSFPQLFLKVKRPSWVTLSYQHVSGETRQDTFHGLTARVVLHEYDHMEGKTMLDNVGKTSIMMAREKQKKLRAKNKVVK